jgi:hypothetical protein
MNTRLAVAAASLAVLASVTTAGLVNPAAYVEALRLGNVNSIRLTRPCFHRRTPRRSRRRASLGG